MAGRLAGKVALVTGAGSRAEGIGNGKAAAVLFAREGASVLCVDFVEERAAETVAMITAEGGTASVAQGDVSRQADCKRLAALAVERYGRLDILQNNVGIPSDQALEDITEDGLGPSDGRQRARHGAVGAGGGAAHAGRRRRIDHQYLVDRRAAGVSAAVDRVHHEQGGGGRAHAGAGGPAGQPPYPRQLHRAGSGVHAAHRRAPDGRGPPARATNALIKDEGTAWDIAWAAVYLASDEARWVTGQVLAVDAGITITIPGNAYG